MDDKFNIWIPKMSEGAKLIKSDQRWNDFVRLRKVRDNTTIHSKYTGQAISYRELADLINAFRLGVGGMLGQIHRHFGHVVPSRVINSVYMPDVEVINNTMDR